MQPAVLHRSLLQRGDLRTLSSVTVLAEAVRGRQAAASRAQCSFIEGGVLTCSSRSASFSIVAHLLTNCFCELCENVQRYEVILQDPAAVWE